MTSNQNGDWAWNRSWQACQIRGVVGCNSSPSWWCSVPCQLGLAGRHPTLGTQILLQTTPRQNHQGRCRSRRISEQPCEQNIQSKPFCIWYLKLDYNGRVADNRWPTRIMVLTPIGILLTSNSESTTFKRPSSISFCTTSPYTPTTLKNSGGINY